MKRLSKGNASFAHGMKNDFAFVKKFRKSKNNCSVFIGIQSQKSPVLMVMNKRNDQIMVPTEKENLAKLMVRHTHFEDAKRTHIGWNVLRLSSMSIRSLRFIIFSCSPQTIRNRFHIVLLRHNHINNRYFGWEEKKRKFPIRIVCVSDMFDAVVVIIIIDCIQTKLVEFVGQKPKRKNWRFVGSWHFDYRVIGFKDLNGKMKHIHAMMQLNRFPISFCLHVCFYFRYPADTDHRSQSLSALECEKCFMRAITGTRKTHRMNSMKFFNRNVDEKKIPFQMILMVECDIHMYLFCIHTATNHNLRIL